MKPSELYHSIGDVILKETDSTEVWSDRPVTIQQLINVNEAVQAQLVKCLLEVATIDVPTVDSK